MARKKKTHLAPTRAITSFGEALGAADPRPSASGAQPDKKNYAQRFSEALAVVVANGLRPSFPGILPLADGTRHESRARTGKGVKKLDVNYSTPELGLALGVSIKTLNFRDPGSKRYTKNATRIDNELRAEAMDYHKRQPYSVIAGVVFLPVDSCDDGNPARPTSRSSYAQIVNVLKHRGGRRGPDDSGELLESIHVGLYDHNAQPPTVVFFDVMKERTRIGRPAGVGPGVESEQDVKSFDGLYREIIKIYDQRNKID